MLARLRPQAPWWSLCLPSTSRPLPGSTPDSAALAGQCLADDPSPASCWSRCENRRQRSWEPSWRQDGVTRGIWTPASFRVGCREGLRVNVGCLRYRPVNQARIREFDRRLAARNGRSLLFDCLLGVPYVPHKFKTHYYRHEETDSDELHHPWSAREEAVWVGDAGAPYQLYAAV